MSYDGPADAWLPADADGTWSAGRIVTLVVPLARSLARLHARGLVHGSVGRYAVRCTTEGMPEFVDEAGSRARSSATTPAADVRALARLADRLIDPAVDDGLVRSALTAAMDGHLDAAGLADQLAAATRAEPLLGVAPVRPAAPRSHRRDRGAAGRFGRRFARPNRVGRAPGLRRGVLATGVAAAGVVAFGVAAVWSGPSAGTALPVTEPPAEPVIAASPVSAIDDVDWSAVVRRLTALRVSAITSGDASLLRGVYIAGADPEVADSALLRGWRRRGRHVVGLDVSVAAVSPRRTTPDTAVVEVTTRLSAYRVVDAGGLVVARSAPTRQRVRLALIRRDGRWLVRQVLPVTDQSTSAETAASTSS